MTAAGTDTATAATGDRAGARPRGVTLGLLAALAAAGLLLLGAAAGTLSARVDGPPGDTSADAGFLRDMTVHHGQAVEMAMALHARTPDPALRVLTGDIALTQQGQIGQMQARLAAWGLSPTGTQPALAWVSAAGAEHGHRAGLLPDARMPGMATPVDVASLTTLPVEEAEVRFLQLMTAHHVAGVEMAEAGVDTVEDPDLQALAESIASGQSAELDVLHDMLAGREAAAEPAAHAGR